MTEHSIVGTGRRAARQRVSLLPDDDAGAERLLEHALYCLREGLPISAWLWTEKASAVLHSQTHEA